MNRSVLNDPGRLREDAEGLLRSGSAPPSSGWSVGAEALSLLYRLASNPDTSGDALKFLHELQTHQVELDLQHAQMLASERDLASRLGQSEALFEHAPAACLVLDRGGRIARSNRTANRLLGQDLEPLQGQLLAARLTEASQAGFTAVLVEAEAGMGSETIPVQTRQGDRLGLNVFPVPGSDAVGVMMFPDSSSAA